MWIITENESRFTRNVFLTELGTGMKGSVSCECYRGFVLWIQCVTLRESQWLDHESPAVFVLIME